MEHVMQPGHRLRDECCQWEGPVTLQLALKTLYELWNIGKRHLDIPHNISIETIYAMLEELVHGDHRLPREQLNLIPNDAMCANRRNMLYSTNWSCMNSCGTILPDASDAR